MNSSLSFIRENIKDASYLNFPIESIQEFKKLVNANSFNGINITIPYKVSIIPLLDELSEEIRVAVLAQLVEHKPVTKLGRGNIFSIITTHLAFCKHVVKALSDVFVPFMTDLGEHI